MFCTEAWPAEWFRILFFPPLLMLAPEFHFKNTYVFSGHTLMAWGTSRNEGGIRQNPDPFLSRVHKINELHLLSHCLQIPSVDSFFTVFLPVAFHKSPNTHPAPSPSTHSIWHPVLITHHTSRMMPSAWRVLLLVNKGMVSSEGS